MKADKTGMHANVTANSRYDLMLLFYMLGPGCMSRVLNDVIFLADSIQSHTHGT
jgi:hypothetical protein